MDCSSMGTEQKVALFPDNEKKLEQTTQNKTPINKNN